MKSKSIAIAALLTVFAASTFAVTPYKAKQPNHKQQHAAKHNAHAAKHSKRSV